MRFSVSDTLEGCGAKASRVMYDSLPEPCLINIFERLNFAQRRDAIPLVCKTWAEICRKPSSMWRDVNIEGHDLTLLSCRELSGGRMLSWFQARASCIQELIFEAETNEDGEEAGPMFLGSLLTILSASLKRLDVTVSSSIELRMLRPILAMPLRNIQRLALFSAQMVVPLGVVADILDDAQHFPGLRQLVICVSSSEMGDPALTISIPQGLSVFAMRGFYLTWGQEALQSISFSSKCLMGWASSLRMLDLTKTFLPQLPEGIKYLVFLEVLKLGKTRLKSLPSGAHLYNLTHLDLSTNALTTIPDALIDADHLRTLYLDQNDGMGLTDDGVDTLLRIPMLQSVRLRKSRWSAAEVSELLRLDRECQSRGVVIDTDTITSGEWVDFEDFY